MNVGQNRETPYPNLRVGFLAGAALAALCGASNCCELFAGRHPEACFSTEFLHGASRYCHAHSLYYQSLCMSFAFPVLSLCVAGYFLALAVARLLERFSGFGLHFRYCRAYTACSFGATTLLAPFHSASSVSDAVLACYLFCFALILPAQLLWSPSTLQDDVQCYEEIAKTSSRHYSAELGRRVRITGPRACIGHRI